MNMGQLIEKYVAYRQSLGERFATNGRILRAFGRSVGKSKTPTNIAPLKVKQFIDGNGPITNSRRKRYDAVLGFYRYAISRGFVTSHPMPSEAPTWQPSLALYIYKREEIHRLLRATDTYPFKTLSEPATTRTQKPSGSLRPTTTRRIDPVRKAKAATSDNSERTPVFYLTNRRAN